jgi:hypothetical protein
METNRKTAENMSDLWRWITIDIEGNVKSEELMTQVQIFSSLPEINPRFFNNFGVVELTIRQRNGTQIKIMKVR